MGYATIAIRSVVELGLGECVSGAFAAVEPASRDGRALDRQLPISFVLPPKLDLPFLVCMGWDSISGVGAGIDGVHAFDMGGSGYGVIGASIRAWHAFTGDCRSGVWLLWLPGIACRFLEHQLHCCLASMGFITPHAADDK